MRPEHGAPLRRIRRQRRDRCKVHCTQAPNELGICCAFAEARCVHGGMEKDGWIFPQVVS
eukprot:2121801-Pleurochrysis_carterae.AAC.2